METAHEGGGEFLARPTTASGQIAQGPDAGDGEDCDSLLREDTLQQMLTCETGNSGTEANAPPCDKPTTGQGLHGTSPAGDNLDRAPDTSSLIHPEAPDKVAEIDTLERHPELEVTSSDESGEWETASEASVVDEETTDDKRENKNESLDGNGKMDNYGQEETGDVLELLKDSGHLEITGSNEAGELAEAVEQCERIYHKDPQSEQAFTHGSRPADGSLCDVPKTEEMPPHAEEALREGALIEEADPQVKGMVTEESCFANIESPIEDANEEEHGTIESVTHVGKSGLHDEDSGNEWTKCREEAVLEAQMEETANGSMGLQKNELASEQAEPRVREPSWEVREPHADKTVPHAEEATQKCKESSEATQRCRESSEKVADNEGSVPDDNELVSVETEPSVAEVLGEQCSPPMEETTNGSMELQKNELASEQAEPQVREQSCDVREPPTDNSEEATQKCRESSEKVTDNKGTVPDDNELVSVETEPSVAEVLGEQCSPPMEETTNGNMGLQKNESASEQAEPQVREPSYEVKEPCTDETVPHSDETTQTCRESSEKVTDNESKVPDDDNELVSKETEPSVAAVLGKQSIPLIEEAVGDGTGHEAEKMAANHEEESASQMTMFSADTIDHYVEGTPSGESYIHEKDGEGTVAHDEACVRDETEPHVGENFNERTLIGAGDSSSWESENHTVNNIIENSKSMSHPTLIAVLEGNSITEVIEENDISGYAIDKDQGPLDTSAYKEGVDSETELVNNEKVVDSPSTINIGSIVDITARVRGETSGKVMSHDQKEDLSQLLDRDTESTLSSEIEGIGTNTVSQVYIGGKIVDTETEYVYNKAVDEYIEGGHKEPDIQVPLGHSAGTLIEDRLEGYAESASREADDGSIYVFNEETPYVDETCIRYNDSLNEKAHTDPKDTHIYQTAAEVSQAIDSKEYVDVNIQNQMTPKENESEPIEDGKSWHAEETWLQAAQENLETRWPEDESSNSGEIEATASNLEANIMFSEDLLEEVNHERLFEIDDGMVCMDVDTGTGAKTDNAEQVFLDEIVNKEIEDEFDKYQSLSDTETNHVPGMLLKPIPMRPVVFSNDSFQKFDVVHEPEEPNAQNLVDVEVIDGVENFDYSHHKVIAERDQSSPMEVALSPRFQMETIKDQIQSVIQAVTIVGPRSRMDFSVFSEGQEDLAEDQPDCSNQALILDRGLKSGVILPTTEPFTKSATDVQEATLIVAVEPSLADRKLLNEGQVVDYHGIVDSSIIIEPQAVGTAVDSLPILITRQRSNTDPCISYDQEENESTQQDDHHEKGKARPRLRSATPPLDNFTASFTATSPQATLECKPLEKAQAPIEYPPVDYDISEEQKAEEATTKKAFTFFPTQIFNPLFFIQEGAEKHGFYQDESRVPHVKENQSRRRVPSPPRDTEVLLQVHQPHSVSISSGSPVPSGEPIETSATDPPAAHPVTPVWLPPRPLRHTESVVGKDFRTLKPTENLLVRRPTVRHRKNNVSGPALKRFSAMNLPTIPQEVPSGEKSSLEKSSRPAGVKVHISNSTRHLPRQPRTNEQDVPQPKNMSPMERLAEAEESSRKSSRSPEAVLRRGTRYKVQPATSDTTRSIHRRYSTLINSSSLLYQEYSDVALNQEIQRQKPGDSPAEEKDPGSPRQRRRILSSQDSYLQRLSISSADSLWQDLPKVRDSVTFMSMSREEQKLQEAKFEMIMSEALYLRSLNIAVDHFQRSTGLHEVLSAQDRQWLFSRLSEVRDASNDFLFDLEEEFENNMYNFQVCDVVISHEPNFRKVYLPYVTNQSYQDRTFQRLMNGNPRFQQVLSRLESDPVCQRLSLKSFLILPFQRITRLRLLLQNILKRSAPSSNEEFQATEAHNAIEKLIRDCNEGVQKMKDTEELILLHQKITFECKIFPLISASRRLVKHGEVTSLEFNPISFKWKGTTRPVYLHLFSDCLLLSRIREGGRFVVFDHASDFRVERCEIKLHSNQKNIFRVFLRDSAATQARDFYQEGQEMQYIFRTETQSQKLRWIYALSPPREDINCLRDDLTQVQCLKSYKARENDEMSLEKADLLMVTQNSDDGWLCGIRLSDLHSGWIPQCHVQAISRNACLRNLQEEKRLQNARAKLHPK